MKNIKVKLRIVRRDYVKKTLSGTPEALARQLRAMRLDILAVEILNPAKVGCLINRAIATDAGLI